MSPSSGFRSISAGDKIMANLSLAVVLVTLYYQLIALARFAFT